MLCWEENAKRIRTNANGWESSRKDAATEETDEKKNGHVQMKEVVKNRDRKLVITLEEPEETKINRVPEQT